MSAPQDNSAQAEYWNGKAGERWAERAAELDRLLAPFVTAVLDAAAPVTGQRVLDVGCGSGALSLAAGEAGAKVVTGVDISVPMLALARKRADGRENISFVEADASAWQAEAPYDRLVSRFGVMFFADPAAAFANLHSQMAEGGKLAFACWQPLKLNDWARAPLEATLSLTDTRPEPPEPGTPGPFAFEDADRTISILKTAGWTNVRAESWSGRIELPGNNVAEAAVFTTKMGPTARLMAEQEIDPDRVREAVEAVLAERADKDGRVRLPAAAWIITASA